MDFVTLSDHDTIAGALEIAHLPGTFLSCEVTVSFPEDGCQLHCLVTGISEAEHRDIQELRGNVYELRDYFRERDILHSIAHPFYRVNDRLTLDHLEKLIVLFDRFEALNGIHDRRGNELVRRILGSLTREVVESLAERHGLEPAGPTPWRKTFTGGSDDHGGLYIATTYTATPAAATVEEYLAHLRAGCHEPGGDTGSTLRLVQSLYSIAHEYYARQFPSRLAGRQDPFAELLRTLAQVPAPPERPKSGLRGRLAGLSLAGVLRRGSPEVPAATPAIQTPAAQTIDRSTFATASKASEKYVISLLRGFLRHARRGRLSESLSALSQLAPLAISVAPYLVALQAQHKDSHLMEAAALRFLGQRPEGNRADKKAWFTDTLTDVNGVSKTVRTLASLARERGHQLVAVTSGCDSPPADLAVADFKPILRFPVPGYESLQMTLPPLLEILDHCERERYSEIIVSTPGPLGLAGLAAGKLLGIPVTGIYHTDFPVYVRHLAGSPALEEMTWGYMRWFFGQMEKLYVASHFYRDLLAGHGFDRSRLTLLPRGVDAGFFHPRRRDARFWRRFGLNGGFKFLYVGRISREKNLDALLTAFQDLLATGRQAHLAVVGDGPCLKDLARRYRHPDILFTGFLHGEELARAYASSDLFVFPSTTDTFGNVVLEAQASGLPAIVTNQGGPQEIVRRCDSGLVIDPGQPGALARAMIRAFDNPALVADMAVRALENARANGWEHLLDQLWTGGGAPRRPQVPPFVYPDLDAVPLGEPA
jgi:glycosyltransferase involved in cell wall biosynthesis